MLGLHEVKNSNNEIKNKWDEISNEYFAREYNRIDTINLIKSNPTRVFPPKVWENICMYYPSLRGLKICVPSSGDNKAVFSFHLLGAEVTSCDISSEQIKNAKNIADS